MTAPRSPSRRVMEEATRLGALMAAHERGIRPEPASVGSCSDYVHFLELHRHLLEQNPAFSRWDERVSDLCRREAQTLGMNLDRPDEFERFLRHIARPIRCSFWYGWETAVGLKGLAELHVGRPEPEEAVQVLRVAGGDSREEAMATLRRHAEAGAYAERTKLRHGGSGIYDLAVTDLEARPGDITT